MAEAEVEEEVEGLADVKAEVEVEVATCHVSEMVVPTAEDLRSHSKDAELQR